MIKTTYLYVVALYLFAIFPLETSARNTSFSEYNQIQRVRINFTTPQGYVRQLLLGFTTDNAASDGVDYGYDALNIDSFPDDVSWMINNEQYVIQGVGAFDVSKQYALGMFFSNSGLVTISLDSLENFNQTINVYIFDAQEHTFTHINDYNYENILEEGEYINRFFVTFTNDLSQINFSNLEELNALSIEDSNQSLEQTQIKYLGNTKELYVKSPNRLKNITLFSLQGQQLLKITPTQNITRFPLKRKFHSGPIVVIATDLKSHSTNKTIYSY
ncbi:hypothetical protein [Mangrovimonas spongiae]|uniref:T9SS C-terminal target domain-containing protein n=1 Tax=Mangrovimonas spongiae TaxID=2494697 RepID=A0A3R9MH77_9FLAO|nr:hypothetical protein [Mangrovimonas spongiae]RSK40436.1 hypothetical protein EJA19_05510 [Mangrovimonas spongiae]